MLRGGFRWKAGGAQVKGHSGAGGTNGPADVLARGGFLYHRAEAVRTQNGINHDFNLGELPSKALK